MDQSVIDSDPRQLSLGPAVGSIKGKSVLYVMSRDQRVADNHALLAAQQCALRQGLPFAVLFCLYPRSGYRAREHYQFMLDGFFEIEQRLAQHNIPFIVLIGPAKERIDAALFHYQPAAVFFDFSPLRGPRALAQHAAKKVPVVVVDTHNSVPVWQTSAHQEYAARTIRPKLHKLLPLYLQQPKDIQAHPHKWSGPIISCALLQPKLSATIGAVSQNGTRVGFRSGEIAAQKHLARFISKGLKDYALFRNDPSHDTALSNLSPYLHYGQLSSLQVALQAIAAVQADASLQPSVDVLLEELLVRKELSDNFCYYQPRYDDLAGAPKWAQITLQKHATDPRQFLYSYQQFESAQTHDAAWNAAQKQLTKTGKMHGYMRMYWAKKVLEWSPSAQQAVKTLVQLNDFYSIDGGDPNGYVGILWSVAGLHDRPWGERPVYGTVRSMVYEGLKRKFAIEKYITQNT